MRHTSEFFLRVAAVAALSLAAAASARAQINPTTPPEPRNVELERRAMERERRMREMDLRITESNGPKTANDGDRRDEQIDYQSIGDDFKIIQIVSRDLLLSTMQSDMLDLKLVEKSASEIRRRAGRLSSGLVLPKSDKGGKRTVEQVLFDAAELKRSVTTLDTLVGGFASNPVFRELKRVDAKLSAKARRDLDEIIELSDRMMKSCAQLNQAAAAGQNQ